MFMSTSLFHLVLGPAQYRKEWIELGCVQWRWPSSLGAGAVALWRKAEHPGLAQPGERRMEAERNSAAAGGSRFSLKHMARKQKTGHKLNLKVWCGEKEVTMSIMKQWNKCDQSWRFSGTGKALRNLLWIQCWSCFERDAGQRCSEIPSSWNDLVFLLFLHGIKCWDFWSGPGDLDPPEDFSDVCKRVWSLTGLSFQRWMGVHPWESVLISTFIYLKGFSDFCEFIEICTEQVLCHVMAV